MKLKAFELPKTASSPELIYHALRDAIVRGQIAEGQTLRQDNLAQMFDVSRIPVREALARLEAQGLVTSTRYKGVVVSSMSAREIAEIFEFRALVEPTIIELAVPQMSEESLRLGEDYCTQFAVETEPARWGDLNRLFHATLCRDCQRPYYLSVMDKTNDRVERYVRAHLVLTQGMERARVEHRAIMDACLRRDAALAAQLTREHVTEAGRSLTAFLQEQAGKQDDGE
jgi:DNA-binding GntR family transcriptional regulator